MPRHQQIVASILGEEHSRLLTILIGLSEVGMMIWVLSGIKSKWNAWTQMGIVAIMNMLEFILVPNLLLWGGFNAVFAGLFIVLVYYNEYKISDH